MIGFSPSLRSGLRLGHSSATRAFGGTTAPYCKKQPTKEAEREYKT
jgi:hypothetical protein